MDNEQAKDTDKLLVARVQKGDKRAFDLLVMKYQYKVHAIVSRYVKDFYEGSEKLRDIDSPENLLYRDELEAVVDLAIKNLPEDLRTAVTLREFEGLSYEEIAEIMGCPVGTVRSRIFRAREAIDEKIRLLEG